MLVRSAVHGAGGARRRGAPTTSRTAASTARTRSRASRRTRRSTCAAPTGSRTSPDILVNSFYDPELDEGCAFEELISFHGGLGGPQTRAFVLHPATLAVPDEPIVGAAAVHALLSGWRESLQGGAAAEAGARRRGRDVSDTVVFIPAWNEEDNLPAVLDDLRAELPDVDVVVVDDGSTDRTADVAREHGAEVLSLGTNRGLPVGIAAGYR